MKRFPAIITCLCLIASTAVRAEPTTTKSSTAMPNTEDLQAVAPALEKYRQTVVIGDLWKRPGLPPRDRGIVTMAALIARNQIVELPQYLGLALDSGVKPSEISEIITHLAFYTGWANAVSAVQVANDVFKARRVGADQLPAASGPQLPLEEAGEAQRATRVSQEFGKVAPGLVQYTT